jgi:hypothetical protein
VLGEPVGGDQPLGVGERGEVGGVVDGGSHGDLRRRDVG